MKRRTVFLTLQVETVLSLRELTKGLRFAEFSAGGIVVRLPHDDGRADLPTAWGTIVQVQANVAQPPKRKRTR